MNQRRVVGVVVALLVAAVGVGGLWVWLSPAPNLVVEHGGNARFATESDPAKLFSGVAIFALLAMALGAVIALVSWFGLRKTRGPSGIIVVAVLSIATSALALNVAEFWGRSVRGALDRAMPGAYRGTANLWFDAGTGQSWLLLLCAPAAAVLVYLVCVIASNHADLGVGDDRTLQTATAQIPTAQIPTGHIPTAADEEPRTRP